jgi:inhibitor of cysteine peptidase
VRKIEGGGIITYIPLFIIYVIISLVAMDTDPAKLNVKLNEEFSLSLESVPTAGYVWEAKFDGEMIKLKNKSFVASQPGAIGGGGIETFAFVPIRTGETKITMIYKRSWEKEAAEERTYPVKIS